MAIMTTDAYIMARLERDLRSKLKAKLSEITMGGIRDQVDAACAEIVDDLKISTMQAMSPMDYSINMKILIQK